MDKTGVFTGSYALNPVTEKEIPIWISDYVLISYGTGAIMGVPAHDERDWDFAKAFDLPIVQVVAAPGETGPSTKSPKLYRRRRLRGQFRSVRRFGYPEAIKRITTWLEEGVSVRRR
jgi:leucyl-tRNA synthetase